MTFLLSYHVKNMLPLIVFSILFGFLCQCMRREESYVGKLLNNLSNVMMKVIDIIMKYAPIGLCAYFANLVGEFGPNLLGAYGRAMFSLLSHLHFHFLVFFTILRVLGWWKKWRKSMFKNILPPTATSIATQSSVATLPVKPGSGEKYWCS